MYANYRTGRTFNHAIHHQNAPVLRPTPAPRAASASSGITAAMISAARAEAERKLNKESQSQVQFNGDDRRDSVSLEIKNTSQTKDQSIDKTDASEDHKLEMEYLKRVANNNAKELRLLKKDFDYYRDQASEHKAKILTLEMELEEVIAGGGGPAWRSKMRALALELEKLRKSVPFLTAKKEQSIAELKTLDAQMRSTGGLHVLEAKVEICRKEAKSDEQLRLQKEEQMLKTKDELKKKLAEVETLHKEIQSIKQSTVTEKEISDLEERLIKPKKLEHEAHTSRNKLEALKNKASQVESKYHLVRKEMEEIEKKIKAIEEKMKITMARTKKQNEENKDMKAKYEKKMKEMDIENEESKLRIKCKILLKEQTMLKEEWKKLGQTSNIPTSNSNDNNTSNDSGHEKAKRPRTTMEQDSRGRGQKRHGWDGQGRGQGRVRRITNLREGRIPGFRPGFL